MTIRLIVLTSQCVIPKWLCQSDGPKVKRATEASLSLVLHFAIKACANLLMSQLYRLSDIHCFISLSTMFLEYSEHLEGPSASTHEDGWILNVQLFMDRSDIFIAQVCRTTGTALH